MKKFLLYTGITAVIIFALIGLAFSVVFAGMHFGLFNVRGSIEERNAFFFASTTWHNASASPALADTTPDISCLDGSNACDWKNTREWSVVKGGLEKDAPVIERVSQETGVPAKLIAAVVVPEQIRFFTAEREVFKRYFEPLKILGSMSQFSLGVSGIKEKTAMQIEQNANDPSSLYFAGANNGGLIAYKAGVNHDEELYNRLTDPKNHYYSYLYTALFIKEIESGWAKSGYSIEQKPGIVATLFNIGFENSHPNATPTEAGAAITTGGTIYSFGKLAGLVYASNELDSIFGK